MAVVAAVIPEEQAAIACEAIQSHFGGNQVYFPLETERSRERRNESIRAAHARGAPAEEIVREHGISYSSLKRILRT